MTSAETARHHLRDLGDLVKEMALKAKTERDAAPEPERPFEDGRLIALHQVISPMQQQARAFGLDLEDLALDDVDPERDLV